MKNSKCLITGFSGFVGLHLASYLTEKKAIVIGLDHHKSELCNNFIKTHHCDFIEASLEDKILLKQLRNKYNFDYVFHLGGMSVVQQCEKMPNECFAANIQGTSNILESCRFWPSLRGILWMDSIRSMGSLETAYDVSKKAASIIADFYVKKYCLPLFGLRACQIYGPGDLHFERLIPKTIMKILNNEKPVIYESAKNLIHEYLYVNDLVRLMLFLMNNIELAKGKTINISGQEVYTVSEIVQLICQKLHYSFQATSTNHRIGNVLDSTYLTTLIPDFTYTPFDQGLDESIAWYKQYLATNKIFNPL